MFLLAGLSVVLALQGALAAPVLLNNARLEPPLETVLDGTNPALPVALLPRLGVRVITSSLDATRLRLTWAEQRLDYSAERGWRDALGEGLPLPAPNLIAGGLTLRLEVLEALGFQVGASADLVSIASPMELPAGGFAQLTAWRAARKPDTVRLEFSRAPVWTVTEKSAAHIVLKFSDTAASDGFAPVGGDAISRVRLWQQGPDAMLELELTARAAVDISPDGHGLTLRGDAGSNAPPAPKPAPSGVEYSVGAAGKTKLHLVKLDPLRYQPRVVTAPWGGALDLLELTGRAGAVAGVNGGYFDPASLQAVDHLVSGGQTWAYWRGARAGVGFAPGSANVAGTVLWGAPRSRLTLRWAAQEFTVNTIQAGASPKYLTAFVGDGFASVGGLGYTTLSLKADGIGAVHDEAFVPAPGELTLSFNPLLLPKLQPQPGDPASLGLNGGDPAWLAVTDAIAAGPRLVQSGAYAVNPGPEGFDPSKEIWRATRQVGFGVDSRGWYVIAMLELGTPEEFARALVTAGLRDALRFDSGTSAQVALAGGLIGGRWGRTVPNALVFTPRQ